MVADDRALELVASDEFVEKLGPGGLHISMSTVSPQTSQELARRHERAGFGAECIGAGTEARKSETSRQIGLRQAWLRKNIFRLSFPFAAPIVFLKFSRNLNLNC